MIILRKFWLIALISLLVPETARGEGNLHIGRTEIHPFVLVAEKQSDNIYFTADDEKNDYITTTTPGISLQFPFRMHRLSLDYSAVFTDYKRYDTENTTDQLANALMDLQLGSLFSIDAKGSYVEGHESRGTSSTGFIEKFINRSAGASFEYKLADISKVQVEYSKNIWDFKRSTFRDRDEDLVSGYLYFRFLPKTSAFIEYDRKDVNFEETSSNVFNNVEQRGFIGLTWEITESSKGTIKSGYVWKDFEEAVVEDFATWTASIDLSHDFSDYSSLKVVGLRTVNETSLQFTRYFITTGAYAEFTHRFFRKVTGVVRGSYGENGYSDAVIPGTKKRKDLNASEGVGLRYTMRDWIELGIDYDRRDRRSNIDTYDYKEESYTATVKFAL